MERFGKLVKLALPLLRWYVNFYILILAILLWYKTQVFTFTVDSIAEEVAVLVFLALLLHSRLALLGRGYGTHRVSLLIFVAWLGPVAAFMFGYHLSYQVYVLHLEEILAMGGLCLLLLEALLLSLLGIVLAESLPERLVLWLGGGATVATCVVLSALHFSLASPTAFEGQDQPTTMTAR
ncbi:unnamed protein product [Durusdinium trenchii]|uniref:Uncharacterized protein n=1 Tax=Durusdinium trenchii TaxID=1381693 RepID=A0ABP0M0P3_9DINO